MRIAVCFGLFFVGAFGFFVWRSAASAWPGQSQALGPEGVGARMRFDSAQSEVGALRNGAGFAAGGYVDLGSQVPFDLFADVDVSLADPELTPADVVQIQMEALQASKENPARMAACYSLASPSNRALTGPLENFARMIQTSAYRGMVDARAWQVGTATFEDDLAIVVVSVIDETDTPSAYRFLLQRQTESPYEKCWMTLAVQSAIPSGIPERPADVKGETHRDQIETEYVLPESSIDSVF